MKLIGRFHVQLYRASLGLIGGRIDGLDIMLLTTIGRKSGEKRVVPLPFFRDGKRFLLIASFGGNAKNPAWLNNLTANPEVEIQVGFRRMKARALPAEGDARDRLWDQVTSAFPRYKEYQKKTDRKIPVVVVEPIKSGWLW